jgi:hypothetical protein
MIAESIGRQLSIDLEESVGGRWTVEVSEESLPIAPSGTIPLAERAPELLDRHHWDRVVYLTDLTQYRADTPLRYLFAEDESSVVVFVPAIGLTRPGAGVRRLLRDVLVADHRDSPLPDDRVRGLRGRLRMLAGMVRSNRPAAMGRALRGCTAVGMASGAFGIFFGSVWPIADSMSYLRLAAISVSVVSALSAWLIVRNGLWTPRRHPAPQSGTLDNASTVVTVWTAVAIMHAVLFVGLAALAGIVVEPSYLAGQLGHPASVLDYLVLGWFSASMGTMAGALGSNFDDETVVREATYSRRWHQRRLMFDDYGS